MGRAERRRAERSENKAKTVTYNLTKEQLELAVREKVRGELEQVKQEATDEAVNTAMILMLTLPCKVLMDWYWPNSYKKRLPDFVTKLLDYYEKWQNGELDIDQMREELWEYGGVRIQEEQP